MRLGDFGFAGEDVLGYSRNTIRDDSIGRTIMSHLSGSYPDPEMVLPLLLCTAAVFVLLSLVIVAVVRSVPSKLILLGVLMMAGAVCFTAIHPLVATLALVMAIVAGILIVAGLMCILISYLVQLFTASRSPSEPKS